MSTLLQIKKRIWTLANTDVYEAGVQKAVSYVEAEAKKNCPVDTGALRRSIASDVSTSGKTVTGTVYTNLDYAPYVEYGTGEFAEEGDGREGPWRYQDDERNWHTTYGQPPQPFLRPALT